MPAREPQATRNLDRYGNPPLTWERARAALAATASADASVGGQTTFLITASPDGQPHATGVGALWLDGDLYFTSGTGTRKSRYLAANPAAAVAVSAPGIDVTVEGTVTRVTDPAMLADFAARCRAGGWPAEVTGDALTAPYSAPSAGPPPWQLYRLQAHRVVGVATAEPHGATRWTFAP